MEVIGMILLQIVGAYTLIGLIFMLTYIVYVGRLIAQKYNCELTEAISRFEKAGSTLSNVRAVLLCICIWPRLFVAMKTGAWEKALKTMVDENDY